MLYFCSCVRWLAFVFASPSVMFGRMKTNDWTPHKQKYVITTWVWNENNSIKTGRRLRCKNSFNLAELYTTTYLLSSCDVNKRNHTKQNTTLTKHAWLSYIEMIINNAAGLVMFRIKNLKTVSLNQNHELIVNAKRFRKHTRSHRAMTTIKLRLCNYNFKNETWTSKIKNSHVSCGLCTFYMVK